VAKWEGEAKWDERTLYETTRNENADGRDRSIIVIARAVEMRVKKRAREIKTESNFKRVKHMNASFCSCNACQMNEGKLEQPQPDWEAAKEISKF
jgi:hypothetical protein